MTDAAGYETAYTYNAAGQIASSAVNGNATAYEYDVAGNISTATDAEGRTVRFEYGETLYPKTRYTQKYLMQKNVKLDVIQVGTKLEIHKWQHKQIVQYKIKNGILPPLNNSEW